MNIFKKISVFGKFKGTFLERQISGLEEICDVLTFQSFPDIYKELGHNQFQKWAIDICKDPDLDVLIIDTPYLSFEFDRTTIQVMRHTNTVVLGIALDNSTDFKHYKEIYSHFDGVICSAPLSRYEFDTVGIPSALFIPQYYPSIRKDKELEKDIDVSFVGNPKADRHRWLSAVKAAGIPLKSFGWGSEGGRVSLKEYENIIQRSKISLNFNTQNHYSAFIHQDSTQVWRTTPTARNIEITSIGTFCLSQWCPEIETVFPDGCIETFTSTDELIEKIAYYLEHNDQREAMATVAKNFVDSRYNKPNNMAEAVRHLTSQKSKLFSERGRKLRTSSKPSPAIRFGKSYFFFRTSISFLKQKKYAEAWFAISRCIFVAFTIKWWLANYLLSRTRSTSR